ncbi:MAG: T9SS type A sorting domain-containing protein [Flavobacteriales bacterium]|nr:T9SS type A sorting domain-containing protein [Flavobacteriales bacterium]MBP7155998.1 T9SS type A sorting domain-containing protein [Flavobacteriales bacterium]HQW40687.1 GEVED domain-containing protein [Flavobacteriales bacterium]
MCTRKYARTLFVPALLACTISAVQAQHPRQEDLRGGTVSGNTYCHPSFFNDGGAPDFIDGVVLGSISTANTGFNNENNGWNDRFFDGFGTVTSLQKGGSFVLTITTGTAPNSHYYAWLDLNRDGTFANNELLGHYQGTGSGVQGTISFTVPSSAPTGYTGLRILCTTENLPVPDPCGGYAYGEAEDYAVLLAPASPCMPVHTEGTTQGDFISVFAIDGITDGVVNAAGEFPYKAPERAFHLAPGVHDLSITSGEFATDNYTVWVDWNNDGDWNDGFETVGSFVSTTAFTAQSIQLNVPDTVWGWFTLRVRCADVDPLLPCVEHTWGETRDYVIVVNNPLLPCLTYNYYGTANGLGMSLVEVNGSQAQPPISPPFHSIGGTAPVVHVLPGGDLAISVTGNAGNVGNLIVGYVDLNNDLDYDDANETGPYVQGTFAFDVMEFNLPIPATTPAGGHLLRVVSYGQGFEFVNACTNPDQGQVMDISFVVDSIQFPCIPGSVHWTSGGDYIDGVQLGDINNLGSGAAYGPVYNNYTGLSTTLITTHDYELGITSGTFNDDNFYAWIDYNDDLDFDDPNELLGSVQNTSSAEDMMIPFTVPGGTIPGLKKMRVRCMRNASPDPCADSYYGETEDYSVFIDLNTAIHEIGDANWSAIVGAASSHITVTGNGALGTIILYDAAGRSISTHRIAQPMFNLPVEDLPNGIYTVERTTNDKREVKRILIMH